MLSYLFDLLHVGRLLVAGDHQVDQREEGPYQKGYVEHVVLVKGRVKPQVPDLQPKNHVDLGVVSIGGERTNAQLHHPHRSNQHQNHIEEETVHPCLVLLHRVETAAAGNTDTELDRPLLHTPQHVETKVGIDTSGQETSVLICQTDEKLIHEGDQGESQRTFGDVTEDAVFVEMLTSGGSRGWK